METKLDYIKLYYQSGSNNEDAFNFDEFGSMVDFFKELILIEDAKLIPESRLTKFRNLLHLLEKASTRKKCYEEKKG